MKRNVLRATLPCALIVAGCSASGGDGGGEQARASLELAAEAAGLEAETGRLVASLAGDPSDAERQAVRRQLSELDAEAAALISSAEADSRYTVELEPVNASGASGTATLVEAGGEVGIEGSLEGGASGEHAVSINGLPGRKGASVCPPGDAASGADQQLSGSEAEDFYGRAIVELGSFRSDFSGTGPAKSADPLSSRAVVISGGKGKSGFEADLPIACGLPVAGGASPSEQVVAGVNETRGALSDLSQATRDLASDRARGAQARASRRLARANRRLREAASAAASELDSGGELSADDQAAVDTAVAELDASESAREQALDKLEQLIAAQLAAKAERERQRAEAIAAAAEPEPAAPPPSAPAPAPAPAPSQGPSVVIE